MKSLYPGVATARAARGKTLHSRGFTHGLLAATFLSLIPEPGAGQWRNRYPRVQGYGHHVYLEGYELPVLTNGPIDPAPSPDGRIARGLNPGRKSSN
ncbi:MAG: hypothetical protein OXL34_17495, partial [Gemmatimonadota bacterium]|nr:hypothetical protein [Gemmatimonadota bacterium]